MLAKETKIGERKLISASVKGVFDMIKEKTFYKSFMVLALSLALQNLLTYGVNMMDTVMLGRYSQDAMGGVSLCNQVQYLLQMLVVGAGVLLIVRLRMRAENKE